ncbi:hypothetical protein Btru_038607 [Bulinus truncatus]|nr:hypothetical protein Btru_038607 [Bulinus truncatus]
MSKLLLINGFPEDVKVHQLVEFIKANFIEEDVCRVWMDPHKEPRAVAMFQTEIDKAKIQYLNGKLHWDDHCIVISATTRTWSVFVRTFHSFSFDAIDKLKCLFTKSDDGDGQSVVETERLDDDCYSLSFQEGWDAVLEVCDKRWIYGGKTLSVCPYFDCFKDSFQNQYDNLFKESKKDTFSKCGIVHFPGSKTITSRYTKEKQILPTLDEALKQHNCFIHESSTDMDFEIVGDKSFTKNISKLFHGVYRKLMDNSIRNDYLALDKVQNFLKKIIKSLNASLILTSDSDQLSLDVFNITDGKVPFEQFVKTLVVIKKCSSLPLKESLVNQNWIEFMQTFNKTSSVSHVFQTKLMIHIAWLSHYSSDMQDLTDEINFKIKEIFNFNQRESFQNLISFPTVSHCNTGAIQQFSDEINPSSESSDHKERTQCTYVYTFQKPCLAKILIALKLQKAIHDKYQESIHVQEISDTNISVSGPRNKVEDIFSTIGQLEKMVLLEEDFLKFCNDKTIQSRTLLLVCNSKHCLKFVHAPKAEILVEMDTGKEKKFTEYLTLLLMAKECSSFPNKNFENYKI